MINLNIYRLRYLQLFQTVTVGIFILILSSCQKDVIETEKVVGGELIEAFYLTSYPTSVIQSIVDAVNVDINAEVDYDVDVYKIIYKTKGPDGTLIEVSGAMMLPKDADDLSTMVFFHGTQAKRNGVATYNPIGTNEGLVGLVCSSVGFATFLPDYMGLGDSHILHPYHNAEFSGGTAMDMLKAAYTFSLENDLHLNGDLYLGGYSEGGFVALAAQKMIEEQSSFDFNIVACAPQAGAYDLYETVSYIMSLEEYSQPINIGYLFTSYNDVYGWNRLADFFNEPYAGKMENLFNGTFSNTEINAQLTTNIKELANEDFINGFLDGSEKDVVDAFRENNLLSWKPEAPIRFYHSNGDEVVPYQNMLTAAEKLKENGATDIEMVTIEGLTHEDAGLPAIIMMLDWFDSLRITR